MLLSEGRVREEWIDYNGHLYDGYYAVIFAQATDAFLVLIGLDEAGRKATRHTIYTLETHVRFLREVKLGAAYRVEAQILEHDAKRVRLFLTLTDTDRDIVAATSEELLISIDQSGAEPRTAPWLPLQRAAIETQAEADRAKPTPEGAGKGITLRR
jgi:acyl-CoA thioester hydrolase